MATYAECGAIQEWLKVGFKVIEMPKFSGEQLYVGSTVYMANKDRKVIFISSDGLAYEVSPMDIKNSNTPVTPEHFKHEPQDKKSFKA